MRKYTIFGIFNKARFHIRKDTKYKLAISIEIYVAFTLYKLGPLKVATF
jgi:hypothetical protein